ncbi:MAG: hypothetical protein COZ29_02680 [Candidatus Moranbacteria bacterium CG_4_10_14_3_um_filter_45_9]|nr:MAG: hypothetical protein AUK19_03665 [Candidatus Moranbacteria bacterium CG2_30_45_14]PIX89923.1 MAG: hypothetical protein COZ29_02680 [Candidatus Moranbacteria bacterium CG_4_10_14_3_um_filter_45_9]PJA85634.1 MAG: hypothetical protein CO143_01375 [Candidatus Moranbacteria bacterium CG_4_9_14_3_um_filter_45_14]
MNFSQKKGFWSVAKESLSRGLFFGVVVAIIGIVGAFTLQAPYRANADFMILSIQEGQDYYTATRSAEYRSRVLSEILYSESFINALVDTGSVDANFLPRDKKNRLEKWSKMLEVKKNPELGFITVAVSGESEREVSKISQAVSTVLSEKSGTLFGNGGDKVSVRLLSGPIIEANPSATKLSFIVLASLLFGFFLNFTFRLLQEEFRSDTFLS